MKADADVLLVERCQEFGTRVHKISEHVISIWWIWFCRCERIVASLLQQLHAAAA